MLDDVAQGLVPQVAVVLEGLEDFGQEGVEVGLFVLVRGNHWAGCADRGSAYGIRVRLVRRVDRKGWPRVGGYARSCCSRKRDSRSRKSWRIEFEARFSRCCLSAGRTGPPDAPLAVERHDRSFETLTANLCGPARK